MHAMKERDIFEEIVGPTVRRATVFFYDRGESTLPSDEPRELCSRGTETGDGRENGCEDFMAMHDIPADADEEEHGKAGDLLRAYFHSLGDIVVLTREEERELASLIARGRTVLRSIIASVPLYRHIETMVRSGVKQASVIPDDEKTDVDVQETLRLIDRVMGKGGARTPGDDAHEGISAAQVRELGSVYARLCGVRDIIEKAQQVLIVHNLRLVVHVVKRYAGKGLPLLDLIQEGNIGLMKAIDRFDYRKGFRFSTYATWWIRQAALRALLEQGKTIRLPVNMMDFYNRIVKASREIMVKVGREPDKEEIAARLRVPIGKIEEILSAVQDPLTLQAPIGDDAILEDFIGDDTHASPYDEAEKEMRTRHMLNILHTLTPREAKVIRMRFGIGMEKNHTLEEVGRCLSITRERVRQIEAAALRKLRQPKRSRLLIHLETD